MGKKVALLKKTFRESFRLWRYYGVLPALYTLVWWLNFYVPTPLRYKMSKWALSCKTRWLDRHIERNYSEIILRYKNHDTIGQAITDPTIWVFWGQGEAQMPELVRACFRQLKRNNPNVRLVTNDNLKEYVDIPEDVINKVESGKITWAHFSDLIRMRLLTEYGGMWIDATGWVPDSIPFDTLMKMRIYSPNGKTGTGSHDICFWTTLGLNWSGWCLWANHKGSRVYGFVGDMLSAMISREPMTLDYVLIDYLIYYAVTHFPGLREDFYRFRELPGENRGRLAALMPQEYDEAEYRRLCETDFVFKLSFRTPWPRKTAEGKTTYYGKLITDLK